MAKETKEEKKEETIHSVKKILLLKCGDKKFYVKDDTKDYHTQYGVVSIEDLKQKTGSVVKTHTGKEFIIMDPCFTDCYEKLLRAPQIIPQKDIGMIITKCGINKTSVVVDAGAGSGALAITLGSIAKKVHTFDIREDHLKVVKKNIEFMGLKNITAKLHDIYESTPVKNADVVTLDVPEPWLAIESISKCLKTGGFLVSYSPCIPQVSDFVEAINKRNDFIFIETIEVVERQWEINMRKIRPKSRSINHSGFLTFVRKMGN